MGCSSPDAVVTLCSLACRREAPWGAHGRGRRRNRWAHQPVWQCHCIIILYIIMCTHANHNDIVIIKTYYDYDWSKLSRCVSITSYVSTFCITSYVICVGHTWFRGWSLKRNRQGLKLWKRRSDWFVFSLTNTFFGFDHGAIKEWNWKRDTRSAVEQSNDNDNHNGKHCTSWRRPLCKPQRI